MWYTRDSEVSGQAQPGTATLWNQRPAINSRSYDQSIDASARVEYQQGVKSGNAAASTPNARGGGITRIEIELAQNSFLSGAK